MWHLEALDLGADSNPATRRLPDSIRQVAADQLVKDGVEVLHTIGGDDTNTAAADLAAFLAEMQYDLCVIGLPKTIDNDVYPITQSLGAWTAAEQGAMFFENIVAESSANPRMVCAATARSCLPVCPSAGLRTCAPARLRACAPACERAPTR